jgi:two-component system CheB/CheR fusion protein
LETKKTYEQLISRIEELEAQVLESQEMFDAIRKGEVDAFVVKNEESHELYTLKSADRTYRVFIEQMNEGAISINERNIILYANPRFAEIMSTELEKLIGFNLYDFIPTAYHKLVKELIKDAWTKEGSKGEIVISNKSQKPLPLLFSLNKLLLEEGVVVSIIITDLSLQKESIHQKKALEKKDEFISIASHELKTPVTSIKGYVQLLRYNFHNEGNEEAAAMLGKVDTQINKLTSLIGDLLDVRKMENGQLQYHYEVFDFNDLVMEIIEETQRVIPNAIRFKLGPSEMIEGDRNKLGQVITNFIENAAKYSPDKTDIIVKTTKDNKNICLSVEDQGIGIPYDQQAKVFERFFRVNGEKENTYSGLGLGLYISSEIIKRHNGTLHLNSEPGEGSVFYFQIPYKHKRIPI